MQEMCERLIAEHQSLDTLNAEELSGRNRADGERGCKVYGYKENRISVRKEGQERSLEQ